MYSNLIFQNINHLLLKNDESTPLIVTLLNLKLNWIYYTESLKNFIKKISSPVHNSSNKHKTSTLHTYICECYDLPVASHNKLDFHPLHLHTFQPSERRRSRGISLSKDFFENDPDYQEISEELHNLPSNRI